MNTSISIQNEINASVYYIINTTYEEAKGVFESQRLFFDQGHTKDYKFRLDALKRLRSTVKKFQEDINEAMYADYKKPKTEAYIGDVGVVLQELSYAIKYLKYWMENESVGTPITLQPSKSKVIYEPKGVVAIFAPWNYPLNLALAPLVGAIAAGNCVILKPASETPHTALVIEKIIKESFQPNHVFCAMGDGKTIGSLLLDNFIFNHIFFTGSMATGKWIMSKAAQHLTPVTLELGGKCPAIVDSTARINVIAKRIAWAKYFNAGQTCLAVDYLLVHESVKDELIEKIKENISSFYGDNAAESEHYCRLVNSDRTRKIVGLLTGEKIVFGGNYDIEDSYIEPTIVEVEDIDSPIMKEEIFGPVLPVITWNDKSEVVSIVRKNRYPLACYIFSDDKKFIRFIEETIEYGGGCVNNAIIHFANHNFKFGGVMNSGMGNYHGRNTFETFSNIKPMLSSVSLVDLHVWYPPYSDKKLNLIKKIQK